MIKKESSGSTGDEGEKSNERWRLKKAKRGRERESRAERRGIQEGGKK